MALDEVADRALITAFVQRAADDDRVVPGYLGVVGLGRVPHNDVVPEAGDRVADVLRDLRRLPFGRAVDDQYAGHAAPPEVDGDLSLSPGSTRENADALGLTVNTRPGDARAPQPASSTSRIPKELREPWR